MKNTEKEYFFTGDLTGGPDGFFSDQKFQNFGPFCWTLEWKMLINIMVLWNILRPMGIFYGQLVIL
jgi:hypothetical protein